MSLSSLENQVTDQGRDDRQGEVIHILERQRLDQSRRERDPGHGQQETRDRSGEDSRPDVDGKDKQGQQPAAEKNAQRPGNALFL